MPAVMKVNAFAGAGAKYSKVLGLVAILVFSFVGEISALSVTVNDVECVQEYVLYEGDTISGNFVVVDHDIFWNSDHPGIDFTGPPSARIDPHIRCSIGLSICLTQPRCITETNFQASIAEQRDYELIPIEASCT
ncbi:Transmembrane emp24 domain-containing protein p24beta3 [Capsicum annuum]|nr:Transmembrane emp24 domain-containing protein p24beta3 [Capsicum annuum]